MFIKLNQAADHGFDEPLGLLSDCHRRIERFLAVLLTIVRDQRDEDGGVLPPGHRDMLDQALQYFRTAAPRHTADEEVSLFPRLVAASHAEAARARATIARLDADHRSADLRHRVVDGLGQLWLREGRLERGQLDELRDQLERLDALYREHIPVEDGELFPAAARILTAADLESVGREMADRRGVVFKAEVGPA